MNMDAMVTITSMIASGMNDFLWDSDTPANIARKNAESANEKM